MPSRDETTLPAGDAVASDAVANDAVTSESTTDVNDRREHPRRKFEAGEVISTARHENGEFVEGCVRNLSEGGLCIEGQLHGVTVGAELMVSVVLPSYAQKTFRCTVCRVDPDGHYWAAQILD